jgi:hypothetical protein
MFIDEHEEENYDVEASGARNDPGVTTSSLEGPRFGSFPPNAAGGPLLEFVPPASLPGMGLAGRSPSPTLHILKGRF